MKHGNLFFGRFLSLAKSLFLFVLTRVIYRQDWNWWTVKNSVIELEWVVLFCRFCLPKLKYLYLIFYFGCALLLKLCALWTCIVWVKNLNLKPRLRCMTNSIRPSIIIVLFWSLYVKVCLVFMIKTERTGRINLQIRYHIAHKSYGEFLVNL